MQRKHLETIIKILIGATFVAPLIVLPSSYIFPFIVPKILWFRTMVLLMLGAYLLLLSINWNKYRIKLTPVNVIVGLFYASFAISTFAGVDWYRSFWDNHERMLGLFTITHYVFYYFIITSVIKEWKDWQWLLRLFLLAGSIVMIIGVWQRFINLEALLNRGSERVSATMGNPIYYSGYGLFLLFLSGFLAVKEAVKIKVGESAWLKALLKSFWFWYAFLGAFLGFLGIFLGGTRGAVLGLIAGAGSLFVAYTITLKEHKKARRVMVGMIVLGLLVMGLLFNFRQTDFVKSIPAVGRLVNSSLNEGTGKTRSMAWQIAYEGWQEKPVFGWGPNNFYYAFNKYYKPEFLEHGWGETWFDNAHNVVMNTLNVQGGVGIVLYFALFGVPIFMLWRGYKRQTVDKHLAGIGTAFLLAHLASLVTVFENPTSYLYFFFWLAFINTQIGREDGLQNNDKSKINNEASIGLSVVIGVVIFLLIFSTNYNPKRANNATLDAIRGMQTSQDIPGLFYSATEFPTPHIDDVRNDFSRTATSMLQELYQKNNVGKAIELFDLLRTELKKNIELHPLDIRVHIQLAQIDMMGVIMKQDPSLMTEAEEVLTDALEKSPQRQQIQYMLSSIKLQLGKAEEGYKLLQDSIDNDPKIAEGWWRLAMSYYQVGEIDQAKQTVKKAVEQGVVFDPQVSQYIQMIESATTTE